MSCPHGEPDPSCCIDCLEGPPAKVAPNLLPSTREYHAIHHGHCARRPEHAIEPGDRIYLTDLGWCCESCASAPT